MKTLKYKSILILCLSTVLILFQFMIPSPWWMFTIPTFLLGLVLPSVIWKKGTFLIGFLSGFISWLLPYSFFEWNFDGDLAEKTAVLIGAPGLIILVAVGVLGGLLTGLALLAGVQLRSGKESVALELED